MGGVMRSRTSTGGQLLRAMHVCWLVRAAGRVRGEAYGRACAAVQVWVSPGVM